MIHAVRCNMSQFKFVEFEPGFNVVLADRTKESTKRDTRNGLGKSTLIEIIHFCLGASARQASDSSSRQKGLLVKPLAGWAFTLDFDLGGTRVSVCRNTSSPAVVTIEGDRDEWPIHATQTLLETRELSIVDWCKLLGFYMFDLPIEGYSSSHIPTFRGLISYFVRRGRDAYVTPFEHHRKQLEVDKQVYNAFLLGLEWTYASRWQDIKDQKKLLEDLRKASQSGLVHHVVGSMGELAAVRVRLEARAREEEAQLRTFRVHPQYEAIEDRATKLTSEIHELVNANFSDNKLLSMYQSSTKGERSPRSEELGRLYREAGVLLPGAVLRRLEDVESFHRSVVANRRQFVSSEMDRIERRIAARRRLLTEKSDERARLLEVLETHKALEEYSSLQQLYLDTVSQLHEVERRIGDLRKFEQGRSDLAIKQQLLQQQALQDLAERDELRRRAIELFNANSEYLYQAPGNLIIDVGPNGYRFDVEIERGPSQGIGNMKVFCYDLMLIQLWSEYDCSPGFLIHDSTIFDGVDERQIALALELAERESRERGFQYICTLNSDTVPTDDFSPGFQLDQFVRLRLTDESADGCLLGIRY